MLLIKTYCLIIFTIVIEIEKLKIIIKFKKYISLHLTGLLKHLSPLLFIQNDLLTLKVTSQLHHLSIKCAIHVLHANKFNPNCLRRRPGEEVTDSVFCDIVELSRANAMADLWQNILF